MPSEDFNQPTASDLSDLQEKINEADLNVLKLKVRYDQIYQEKNGHKREEMVQELTLKTQKMG